MSSWSTYAVIAALVLASFAAGYLLASTPRLRRKWVLLGLIGGLGLGLVALFALFP